jgi:predicted dehydrogenase
MMNPIRFAILGCGKVAHLHAKALKNLPLADFRAVWSRTATSADDFARQYGVTAYSAIGDMVRKEKIDAVIVCTPHPFHLAPAIEAMEAGAHVLIEKPLASNLQDCDGILAVARNTERVAGVISQRRWNAASRRVKAAIDAGKIGAPVLGTVQVLGWRDEQYYAADPWRGTWKEEGGGILVNQSPHQLDMLLWYMGEIESVFGAWANVNHPYIEVDDTALAIIRFKNGALGNVLVSNAQKPGLFGKVHVHGKNGASVGVQTDGGAMFVAGMSGVQEPPVNDLWTVPGEENMLAQWKNEDTEFFQTIDPTVHYMQLQIEDFARALLEGRQPLVTGEDGRRVVELFTAIYRSNRDGQPVHFPLAPEYDRRDFDGRLTGG